MNGLFSFFAQVPGAGSGEGPVLDGRRAFHPAAVFPVEPAISVLIEDADGPVEEFGQLHSPAGPAFYGVVWLDPAHHEHLEALIHHVEDHLHHLADGLRVGIASVHPRADDLHTDIASGHLFGGKFRQAPGPGRLVAVIGVGDFVHSPLFSLSAELGFRASQAAAVMCVFFCIRHSILHKFTFFFHSQRMRRRSCALCPEANLFDSPR